MDEKPDLTLIDGGKTADHLPVKVEHRGGDQIGDKLTSKMHGFINSILKDGMNQSDAYRANYSVNRMSDNSIWNAACKLFALPKVSQRIEAGRKAQETAAVHSGASLRSDLIKRLEQMTRKADTDANRLRAMEILGKTEHVSLFLDRSTDVVAALTPDQVQAELEAKLKEAFESTG
jgi:hypothetical protein